MNKMLEDRHEELFLPESLVKIVLKIAKIFELTSYDEFSLLDTLQFALVKKVLEDKDLYERNMIVTIVNLVRTTEKFNRTGSQLTRFKLCSIFPNLDITDEEFNRDELNTFKLINFQVVNPLVVELIYNLIALHLSDLQKQKSFIFEFSMDILRFVYTFRNEIYQTFIQGLIRAYKSVDEKKLRKDLKLLATGVLTVMLRIIHVPDRFHNHCFDIFVTEICDPEAAKNLNVLSAIIFDFIRNFK